MSGGPRWSPDDIIEDRDVLDGRPWWVTPARVVEDTPDRVVVWPAGTRSLRPVTVDRAEALRELAARRWVLGEKEWFGGDSLLVIPRDAAYARSPFRSQNNAELVGWYCNRQQPVVRTDRGFDTDWTLDIWAEADLSGWHRKDEDELELGARLGLSDRDRAEARGYVRRGSVASGSSS